MANLKPAEQWVVRRLTTAGRNASMVVVVQLALAITVILGTRTTCYAQAAAQPQAQSKLAELHEPAPPAATGTA